MVQIVNTMSSDLQEIPSRDSRGERKRLKILRALQRIGGKAKTSEINNEVGFGTDLVRHHCSVLENERTRSQVEFVGKEKNPNPVLNDTNVYRITEHGREVLEAAGDDALSVAGAETFVELRSEIVALREELNEEREAREKLRQSHNELVKTVEHLQQ